MKHRDTGALITSRPRGRRAVLGGGSALVALLGAVTVLPHPTVAGLIGLAALTICLVALYRVTIQDVFSPVAVTFWAFVAVWAGFAPLFQIRDDRLPWPDLPLHQHYVTAQVILLFAVVAYWVGYTRRVAPPPTGPDARTPTHPRRFAVSINRAAAVTAAATLLAIVCLPQTGGLAVRFASRDDLQNAIRQAGLIGGRDLALLGLLSTLPAATSMVGLVLCLLCWRNRDYTGQRAKRVLTATTVVAAALNIVYNNPLSANRFVSFSTMLAICLALVRFDRRYRRYLFSAGMLLGLAIVYPLANLFRNERSRGNLRLGADAYYTWDFDGFQQSVNAVNYVEVHGHTWGHHLVSALLFWVPRSLWEGKAIAAGNAVAANRGYQFQNLALPFWAEVFVEFTLVGVIVVFFLYGLLARRLDGAMRHAPAGAATAVAVIFAACQIGLLRGPLGAQIPFVGAAFAVLVVSTVRWPAWPSVHRDAVSRDAVSRDPGSRDPGSTARPRIAVLADWWWPETVGGAERSARAAALDLARSADVAVFVPAVKANVYEDGPLTVHAVPRPFARRVHADTAARRGIEFLTAWLLPPIASPLIRAIAGYRPDLVIATNVSRTGPWLVGWARAEKLPFVRSYHDLSDTCWRRSRLKGDRICTAICGECRIKTSIMRRATPPDAFSVCVSQFVRTELVRAELTDARRSLVGYPLKGSPGGAEPRRHRPVGAGVVLGYLGRLSPVKGIEAAIHTAARYARGTDRAVSMLVAGEGRADYVRELAALAAAQSVEVTFAGHLDVDEFCARVDAALVPSTWLEPFGRVAVEVGSRGTPMLISPLGGLPEAAAVSGGRYAFADFRDPDAAARALADLLEADSSAPNGAAPPTHGAPAVAGTAPPHHGTAPPNGAAPAGTASDGAAVLLPEAFATAVERALGGRPDAGTPQPEPAGAERRG